MIRFNNEDDGYEIARFAGCQYNPAVDAVISRVGLDEKLLGGVIYQTYTGVSMSVHMAGFAPNWATRDLLWVCFDYPFNQLGCHSLFAQVPSYNDEALDIDLRLGFNEVARIDDVFPDGDLIVLRMRKDDCKWLALNPRAIKRGVITAQGNSEV